MDNQDIRRISETTDGYSIVLDRSNECLYAYMLHGNEFVSDVWIRNYCRAPDEPLWANRINTPCPNAFSYIYSPPIVCVDVHDEFEVIWDVVVDNQSNRMRARVYRGDLEIARMIEHVMPGSSINASATSPIALPMIEPVDYSS